MVRRKAVGPVVGLGGAAGLIAFTMGTWPPSCGIATVDGRALVEVDGERLLAGGLSEAVEVTAPQEIDLVLDMPRELPGRRYTMAEALEILYRAVAARS